jgi:hypothetical protein
MGLSSIIFFFLTTETTLGNEKARIIFIDKLHSTQYTKYSYVTTMKGYDTDSPTQQTRTSISESALAITFPYSKLKKKQHSTPTKKNGLEISANAHGKSNTHRKTSRGMTLDENRATT